MYISRYLVVAMEIQVGKEEVKDWWFYYTFHTNPPPEPVSELFSVPSELVFSERIPELVDTFYFPSEPFPELAVPEPVSIPLPIFGPELVLFPSELVFSELFYFPSELVLSAPLPVLAPEFFYTYYFPSELGPELISEHELSFFEPFPIPSELEPESEHLFSDFRYKPDFSEAFCCVDLRFGYLAWALSALGDFLEVEMVESPFFQS